MNLINILLTGFFRILLFIPLIWILFMFNINMSIIITAIPCLVACFLFSVTVIQLFKKHPKWLLGLEFTSTEEYNKIKKDFLKDYTYSRSLFSKLTTNTFYSIQILSSKLNRLRILDLIVILVILIFLRDNPFIGKYVGVNLSNIEEILWEETETNKRKQLYLKEDLDSIDQNFDHISKNEFMYYETVYLNGYISQNDKRELNRNSFFSAFNYHSKLSLTGIFTSLLESIIKSFIWIGSIYMLIGLPVLLNKKPDSA